MQSHLIESIEGGVLTLTMNRPEARNALSLEMSAQLVDALRRAQQDAEVRAVVLTGAGGAFCAGGDVKRMATGQGAKRSVEARAEHLIERAEAARLLHEIAKPTIAVIPGAAAGAGLALALACDFRLTSATAKLTMAFAKIGLAGDYGASYLLTQTVGVAKARELLMLCPVLNAAEALALGLVHRVFPSDSFAADAAAFVTALAQGPSVALGHIKQNINLAARSSLRESIESEALRQALCLGTEDHAAAARAFVEKKPPVFAGR